MAINFDKALGIHQYTIGIRSQAAEIISNNIANADTPHFKARGVDFTAALQQALSKKNELISTHSSHLSSHLSFSPELKYRNSVQPDTGDGNTVDVQNEQALFMKNAMQYQMSLGFLDGKFAGLKKALKGN